LFDTPFTAEVAGLLTKDNTMEAETYQQRQDQRSSDIVNKGIAVQDCFSTLCAIEYMKSHNVRPDIIERVLLHPDLRRKVPH
jgi:hypothetical protein